MAKGKSGIDGRNMGLDNKVTLGILDVALSTLVRENRYPSKLELADGIRHYYNSKKMSAEYKQIKKLLPPREEDQLAVWIHNTRLFTY
jgi:hypothetical protein